MRPSPAFRRFRAPSNRVRNRFGLVFLLLGLATVAIACSEGDGGNEGQQELGGTAGGAEGRGSVADGEAGAQAPRSFVGADECIRCHVEEGAAWRGSHHDRSMEKADSETVLGRFDESVLRHFDQTWRFDRERGDFVVEVEEPGSPAERLQVLYTFGVEPLQQVLVPLSRGRLQALPIAWDSRPEQEGGQRWIDLQPSEPTPPGDPLHWKSLAYNWNSQCASCHSTRLEKRYDPALDRFDTRHAEIDVGCEACHGPGSWHVSIEEGRQARGTSGESGFDVVFEAWDPQAWQRTDAQRIAVRTRPRSHDSQIDVCAPCHSRRSRIVPVPEIGDAFLDGHRPRLLDPGLYFEDGQIRDEVYVWGSFLQSRMAMAGVRCSDCHEPHSLRLRREGNALCLGCHAPAEFDVEGHHGHPPDGEAGECVVCHMPERVYMRIDARRDHAFPIPRPETNAALGTPDVCEGCHAGRGTEWAEGAIGKWRQPGTSRPRHWSDHLVRKAGRREDPERWLEIALDEEAAPLVRANAWSRFAREAMAAPPLAVVQARMRDGTALERLALVEVARLLGPGSRMSLLRPLLEDERRAIRIGAAEALSELPASAWRPADRALLARALREYRTSQEANAERPEAQVNLGTLALRLGEFDRAREAFRRAVSLAPYFLPAYANWAELERLRGRDPQAVALLEKAVAVAPEEPLMRHALGLALHRTGRKGEALAQLGEAAKAAPDDPRLGLAWALALDDVGRRQEAVALLAGLADRGRANGDVFHALVAFLRDRGDTEAALERVREWLEQTPDDPRARALERSLVEGR